MKRLFVLLMVVCLPLFAMAGLLSQVQQLGDSHPKSPNRNYRINHQIFSDKEEGMWVPSTKSVYNYTDTHSSQIESILMYLWEEDEWQGPGMSYEYEYNAAGFATSSTMMIDIGIGMLPFARTESTFDSQNRITRYEAYHIDMQDLETWTLDMWVEFEYQPNNRLEMFSWELDGGSGQYHHSTFDYDSSGRITKETSSASPDNQNWTFDTKDETTYHPQDNSTGADFIAYLSQIYGSNFFMLEWNLPILVASDTSYFWNGEIWVKDYRTSWEYDGSLRRTLQNDDNWNADEWVTEEKTFFHYNTNGNLSSVVMQENYTGSWEDETKIEYFWEGVIFSEDLVQDASPALQIKAWPMPFSENLNISTSVKLGSNSKISIYNTRGQMIREFTGSETLIWDGKDSQGRDSAAGIYFIRALQDNASATTKVIRVK